MEIVPFSLSSLDSFDQSDQRDTSSPCDGFFPRSQCDQQQDTFLQGDTTNTSTVQLQPAQHHAGVKPIAAGNLSIFRPRFRSDCNYYEQNRDSNQASSDCSSFEESARCPTTLQQKRLVQVSAYKSNAIAIASCMNKKRYLYMFLSSSVPSHLVKPGR